MASEHPRFKVFSRIMSRGCCMLKCRGIGRLFYTSRSSPYSTFQLFCLSPPLYFNSVPLSTRPMPPPPLPYQDPFPAFHFIITSPASALKTTSSPPLNNKPNKVGLHWNNLRLGEKCEGILMSLSNNDLICIYILFTATFHIATLGPMYLESHKQLRCSKCCMQGCHCYQ